MKCLDPVLCYRTSSGAQYRHFSLANRLFLLKYDNIYPCGTCTLCRKQKARELAMRCVLHASLYQYNCFLTLTYDETKETYHNDFEYKDIQDFKKRLRRHCDYHFKKKIQIFNVHEYGKNGKKHWHLVCFNHNFPDRVKNPGSKYYNSSSLSDLWRFGHHSIGDVSEASAMYTAQYAQKDVKNGNTHNNKKSHSKHSGIGRDYFLKHYNQILRLGHVPFDGKELPLPRYFQKLAHKHYSHFYEPGNFFDYPHRKKLYTPFKIGQESREIAELYREFSKDKQIKLLEAKERLDQKINDYLSTGKKPDFILSADNYLYDQQNKQPLMEF